MQSLVSPPTASTDRAPISAPADGALGYGSRSVFPYPPRQYPGVNWIGVKTLFDREIRRFLKVMVQTVFAPTVSTLLFMMVFAVALNGRDSPFEGVSYSSFVAPGLILMGALNNAFANSSSSLQIAKVQGTTIDFLTPPLTPWELTAGFVGGATARGMLVAFASAMVCAPFASLHVSHLWALVFFGIAASVMMGGLGVIGGVWAEKFDHLAAFTGFVITPMTFLSGTFYRLDSLPEPFHSLSHWNPMYYLVDGFRYGFVGQADSNLFVGVSVTLLLSIAVVLGSWSVFDRGWRLKA